MVSWFKQGLLADAAGGDVETDEAAGSTPTRSFGSDEGDATANAMMPWMGWGEVNRVHFYLAPANAVTYRLQIYEASEAAHNMYHKIFDTIEVEAGGCVAATEYDAHELVRPFFVRAPRFYYVIDWSGAPGNTTGFISVEGKREQL